MLQVVETQSHPPDGHSAPADATAARPDRFGRLYGRSEAMCAVYRMIEKAGPTDATVFIVGESGCGKELVARSLHDASPRRDAPFLAVNCGALPSTLIEAELFGHEKGAFTGALKSHRGWFERAAGGTLFLDEITEMSPAMQVRLLRVLETGVFARVGGEEDVRADARIVAATNRDPAEAVRAGRLREDLLYRLAVFPIELPPLRVRGDDVDLLAEHFLQVFNAEAGTAKRFSAAALRLLRSHAWPGNVRELRNVVQRAFILADDLVEIDPAILRESTPVTGLVCGSQLQFQIGVPLAEMERQTILATLRHFGGDKRRCAEVLGVSLKTLYNRLAEYNAGARATA